MINTMTPGKTVGHDEGRGDVLKRINEQYGAVEEAKRDPVKKLGKDEFFKIMITQIQHQDPLKPYQNEEMAAQLAQFTALEQMTNVNSNLEKLTQSQQPLHQLGAANLIGKYVSVDSSRVFHTEGKYSELQFDLPADAKSVRLALLNEKGESVREFEEKDLKKGINTLSWDGKGANHLPVKGGMYRMSVVAENDKGVSIPVQTSKTEVVHGISFDGKDTVLLTGDIRSPKKTFLRDVSRIVDNPQAITNPGMIAPPVLDLPQEKTVQGMTPGAASKYMAFNPHTLGEMQEKPVAQAPETKSAGDKNYISPVNPAALERGYGIKDSNAPADQQIMPSSDEGSTAGKWNE